MATFEKRGKKWRYKIRYRDESGEVRFHSESGFATKTEAREHAKITEVNLKSIVHSKANMKLDDYITEYIEKFRVDLYADATVDADLYAQSHIKKFYGDKLLKNVTPSNYQEFVNQLIKSELSKSTIKKCHSLMLRVLGTALKDGVIRQNSAEFATFKYNSTNLPKEHNYLLKDEIKPFLDEIRKRDVIQYYLFRLVIETGLRIGEACALRFEDIDRANNVIHVTKSYDQKRDALGDTKTRKNRDVYISNSLAVEMFKLLQIQNAYKIVNNDVYNNKYNFIFVNEFGEPIPRSTIYNSMIQVSERMFGRKRRMSAHDLRRTHASLLFESGVPMKAISNRLGHSDTQVTEKIYAHITSDWEEKALDEYNEFISKVF
ncbi:tyrosine-type recombinase/integrase [Macrococcus armenti]|uniref:tyrosine-type recombinase/integrase n=1 Tax=Macrococcus armenti TaxID=2875764 RepID=UPI001CCE7958|nr:site-specific integrase [Macrococcus armenti]UBH16364.1 site-specific integrase [Macrococcus armenti]UBH18720.1 site-specific integrase [Macrococcus armenti]UBH20992.1 site-specific integrase [Macrococcus armenti]